MLCVCDGMPRIPECMNFHNNTKTQVVRIAYFHITHCNKFAVKSRHEKLLEHSPDDEGFLLKNCDFNPFL